MHNVDALVANDAREPHRVERHREGVFGGRRKRQPDAPLGLQFTHHASAARSDQAPRAGLRQRLRYVHGATFGAARLEIGDDLHDRAPGDGTIER